MVLTGLIIVTIVLIVLAVPRIWRMLSMPAAGRRVGTPIAAERKR